MSKWITGRRPTSDDADKEGMVLTFEVGSTYWGCVSSLWHWMSCPPLPAAEPPSRTLESVAKEMCERFGEHLQSYDNGVGKLMEEMMVIVKGQGNE